MDITLIRNIDRLLANLQILFEKEPTIDNRALINDVRVLREAAHHEQSFFRLWVARAVVFVLNKLFSWRVSRFYKE